MGNPSCTVIEGVGNDFEYLAITHSSIYYSFGVTSSAKLLYEMCYIDEHNNFEKVY